MLMNDPAASIFDFDWRALSFLDVEHVRSRLRLEGYAASVVNGTLSALKGVARRAWRLEQMTIQTYERIRDVAGLRGNHLVRAGRALCVSEIVALFRAVEHATTTAAGARDAALLALLYGGGLRCGEVIRLEISDWNSRSHRLRVHGKGDRDRTVFFLDGGSRRALNQWLRWRGAEDGPLLCPVDRHGHVHLERKLSVAAIYKALGRRAGEAGISHFSAHDLRRSGATHLHEKTGNIELVREFLGHVFVQTSQVYIRTSSEKARRRAAAKMRVPFRTPSGKSKRRKGGRRRSPGWKARLRSSLN